PTSTASASTPGSRNLTRRPGAPAIGVPRSMSSPPTGADTRTLAPDSARAWTNAEATARRGWRAPAGQISLTATATYTSSARPRLGVSGVAWTSAVVLFHASAGSGPTYWVRLPLLATGAARNKVSRAGQSKPSQRAGRWPRPGAAARRAAAAGGPAPPRGS